MNYKFKNNLIIIINVFDLIKNLENKKQPLKGLECRKICTALKTL